MDLRDYQQKNVGEIQAAYRSGSRSVLYCAPTGSGKSATLSHMMRRTNQSVLLLAPRESLIDQLSKDLGSIPHGVLKGGGRIPDARIVVGMVQTVVRRLDDLPKFGWVGSDECHLSMSATWSAILEHYKDAWHLGTSATPCRLDGKPLGTHFQKIVYGPSPRELIAREYLVPPRVFAPPISSVDPDVDGTNMAAAARQLNTRAITGDAIEHFLRLAPGRRTMVFTCNRQHCEDVAAQFQSAGVSAVAIDSTMSDVGARIQAHKTGQVQVLVNVDLCTTGYDDPLISCLVSLRPTDSLALCLQMWGRGLRIAPWVGKRDCIILDHVGNVLRHGMPDDDREWTLEGRPVRHTAVAIRQCSGCWSVFSPAPRCPACGLVCQGATVKGRSASPKRREGTLEEVQAGEAKVARAARGKAGVARAYAAETADEARSILIMTARENDYAPGWVGLQMKLWLKARMRRRA